MNLLEVAIVAVLVAALTLGTISAGSKVNTAARQEIEQRARYNESVVSLLEGGVMK